MRSPPLPVLAALSACLASCMPAHANAQPVQRCIGADGRAVYTDQKCEAIGATARLPRATAAEGARMFNSGCPRMLSQLVGEIGAAIRGGEVNRLASLYDWSGVSSASASRLLDRLEAVVSRPLVDIAPVYPDNEAVHARATQAPGSQGSPPEPATAGGQPPDSGPGSWMPSWSTRPAHSPDQAPGDWASSASYTGLASAPPAPPPSRPRPVALRIEQTLAGGATPVRTVFGLRRSYGCFWITL